MKNTVLFDLGYTLIHPGERTETLLVYEHHELFKQAFAGVQEFLRNRGLLRIPEEDVWPRVKEEMCESEDHRVRPLEERLVRIFQLDDLIHYGDLKMDLCRCFVKPIFARHCIFEDAFPTLQELRSRGLKTAIVSNIPWGGPAEIWRGKVKQLGLSAAVDAVVFCRDVGWQNPRNRYLNSR